MKKIIANFKMNLTPSMTKEYLMQLLARYVDSDKVTLCLSLPYTSLAVARFLLEKRKILLGAQNVCDEEEGKNTGEISGAMLKDAGVSYVIVGHSERRKKFKEDNKAINHKIKVALKNGLGVVLCVGESLADYNTLKTYDVLTEQLEAALKGLYENELENITIAYEPIWAIGTGTTPSAREIDRACKTIRNVIKENFSQKASENIEIVYGGSINTKNINQFKNLKYSNGFLIGGSCLDLASLLQIISVIEK